VAGCSAAVAEHSGAVAAPGGPAGPPDQAGISAYRGTTRTSTARTPAGVDTSGLTSKASRVRPSSVASAETDTTARTIAAMSTGFYQHSPGADHDERPECRIVHYPERKLDPAPDLLGNEDLGSETVGQVLVGPGDRLERVDSEDHSADVGLVQDTRGVGFEDHRKTDLRRCGNRPVTGTDPHRVRRRDSIVGEQSERFFLVEHPPGEPIGPPTST
jgi:hypothetical protein